MILYAYFLVQNMFKTIKTFFGQILFFFTTLDKNQDDKPFFRFKIIYSKVFFNTQDFGETLTRQYFNRIVQLDFGVRELLRLLNFSLTAKFSIFCTEADFKKKQNWLFRSGWPLREKQKRDQGILRLKIPKYRPMNSNFVRNTPGPPLLPSFFPRAVYSFI